MSATPKPTISQYSNDERAHSLTNYGVQYPNYLVRALNGLARTKGPAAILRTTHLEEAQRVLRAFDRVFILERGDLNAFFGDEKDTALSNNRYSTRSSNIRHSKNVTANVKAALAAPAEFIKGWRRQNQLDVRLYDWAVQCAEQDANQTRWKC